MMNLLSLSSKAPLIRYGRTLGVLVPHVCKMPAAGMVAVRHMSLSPEFENAKTRLGTLKEDPGNEAKLKIYALFKQATSGVVTTKRPGMMDFVGRAKWDAWNSLGNMSQEEAQNSYIELVNSLVKAEEAEATTHAEPGQKYNTLLVTCEDGLRVITLNRPSKKNAITKEMYNEWAAALEEATADPKTVVTAITGAGDYYCSGNDLSNFMNIKPEDMQQMALDARDLLKNFVASFIDFPKPLVAVVNGPAVGVSVTILGMFDAVYASDKATFNTPFSALGQSPEGCSSYIFPKIMGYTRASELLLFNKKVTAHQAKELGLVTEVFPNDALQSEVWPKLQAYAKLPVKSLVYSKALTRQTELETLHKINAAECERLAERWVSDDCVNAIMNFFNRKK
ncbi:Enoyl-CoA delta isomerase 2, mitochondrial [Halocaridina rubra]|uniref:Enoyl-CoA delta isomerase 2, mitochondrial n=1 Tax=Halocaridina rubra TaxID=373956 RepID=A0AAN8XJT3_HALRR